MVNKKQHLQNLDPTTTLPDLLFASHSLFVGTYYYICCLLYVSAFDFSGKKFLSTSNLYGGDGKIGLTMHGIYPAPTLPDPLPCWEEVIMADPLFPAIWIILFLAPTLSTILTYYKLEQKCGKSYLHHHHEYCMNVPEGVVGIKVIGSFALFGSNHTSVLDSWPRIILMKIVVLSMIFVTNSKAIIAYFQAKQAIFRVACVRNYLGGLL